MMIPFQLVDWTKVPMTEYAGITGSAYWKTIQLQGLRLRLVTYSAGYLADHWCQIGHIVYCLEGELTTELKSGEYFILQTGMSYIVSDEMSEHRSRTTHPVKLLIIDGQFLKSEV